MNDQKLKDRGDELRWRAEQLDRHPTAPYPDDMRAEIAEFVDRARRQTDWTWKRLSEMLGISQTTLGNWHREFFGSAENSSDHELVPVHLTGTKQATPTDRDEGLTLRVDQQLTVEGLSFEEALEAVGRLRR